MSDRRSDSAYDKDAQYSVKLDRKTVEQLSSSAKAAQDHRTQSGMDSFHKAFQRFKAEEEREGAGQGRDNSADGGKK